MFDDFSTYYNVAYKTKQIGLVFSIIYWEWSISPGSISPGSISPQILTYCGVLNKNLNLPYIIFT